MHRTTVPRTRLRSLVGLAAGTLLLAGCVPLPWEGQGTTDECGAVLPVAACSVVPGIELAEAEYSQSQALPDFDTSTYVVTDPDELDRLEALLVDHRELDSTSVLGDCDGGRTTTLEWTSTTGTTATIEVDTCTDDPFAADVDALVSEWHDVGDIPAP